MSATLSLAPAEISLHFLIRFGFIAAIVTFVTLFAPSFGNLNCLKFHFIRIPPARLPLPMRRRNHGIDLRHRAFAAQLPSRRCFRAVTSGTTCAAKGGLQHVIRLTSAACFEPARLCDRALLQMSETSAHACILLLFLFATMAAAAPSSDEQRINDRYRAIRHPAAYSHLTVLPQIHCAYERPIG